MNSFRNRLRHNRAALFGKKTMLTEVNPEWNEDGQMKERGYDDGLSGNAAQFTHAAYMDGYNEGMGDRAGLSELTTTITTSES